MANGLWIRMTLAYLAATAAAGAAMRWMAFSELGGIRYDYLLHAHSHLAILGWGGGALYVLILRSFRIESAAARFFLVASQATAGAMFVAFAAQGYALFSILLSTLHIAWSYGFAFAAWRMVRGSRDLPTRMLRASLLALVVSSAGPWTLAVVSAMERKDSALYDMAIYFYLHVQYNGWMTLAIAAIGLRWLLQRAPSIRHRLAELGYRAYAAALAPGYLLSILWVEPGTALTVVAATAGWVQWAGILAFLVAVVQPRAIRLWSRDWASAWLGIALAALVVKSTMELGLTIPALGSLVYDNRNVVIGYLHLTLLGFVTFCIIGLWLKQGYIAGQGTAFAVGSSVFLLGFMLNEAVLFLDGLAAWLGAEGIIPAKQGLLAASVYMLIGSLLWLWRASPPRT